WASSRSSSRFCCCSRKNRFEAMLPAALAAGLSGQGTEMFVTPGYAQETAPAEGDLHTETGVAHDAGHGEASFPPFDSSTFPSQLLWLAITFGLFYLFLKKVVLPRIGGILEVRRDRI